ncbi:HesB/IscA family protein [Chloroflexota bacterium]
MLTVTDGAKEELQKALLAADSPEPGMGLRLYMAAPNQLDLTLDAEREGDQVVEHEGSKVLLLAQDIGLLLDDVIIDWQDTPEGRGLVLYRTAGSCGCQDSTCEDQGGSCDCSGGCCS